MKTFSIIAGWLGLVIAIHATNYTITTGTNGSGSQPVGLSLRDEMSWLW